jgi:hypothetical protein
MNWLANLFGITVGGIIIVVLIEYEPPGAQKKLVYSVEEAPTTGYAQELQTLRG